MGKVMRVYLCGQDWTSSHEEMYLDLPAAPWELVDAMEKLNLTEEADLYVQAEEYYLASCMKQSSASGQNDVDCRVRRTRRRSSASLAAVA